MAPCLLSVHNDLDGSLSITCTHHRHCWLYHQPFACGLYSERHLWHRRNIYRGIACRNIIIRAFQLCCRWGYTEHRGPTYFGNSPSARLTRWWWSEPVRIIIILDVAGYFRQEKHPQRTCQRHPLFYYQQKLTTKYGLPVTYFQRCITALE